MVPDQDHAQQLNALREQIDDADCRLVRLLNERMRLAREIGRIKAANGVPPYDPSREEVIYRKLVRENEGPLSDSSLRAIYREILAASRLLQYPLQVAFQGPEWSHSHLAAFSLFGHSTDYVALPTLEHALEALTKGKVQIALAPIENSLEGGVGRTMDLLYELDVKVVREAYVEIAHYLVGRVPTMDAVRNLYAEPQAYGQCRKWVLENLGQARWHQCASTAAAARSAREDPAGAAILNLFAAYQFELPVLAERIEDRPGNITRFFALGNHANAPTELDKTSLMFAVADQPGALHTALDPFTRFGLNMTRIESRPNPLTRWQYLFFADIEGNCESEQVQQALNELRGRVTFLKVLGSYPMSDPDRPIRIELEELQPEGRH